MITKLLKRLSFLIWFLPGFLLWASFPPMAEKTDVLFALAPILWFARHNAPGRSFKCWFVNGLFFWIATLSWMPAIIKNGGPSILVVLGWGVLAAYCALYFGLFGWLSSKLWLWTRRQGKGAYAWRLFAIVIGEPLLWAGLELVRGKFCGGFAWNQLGIVPVNAGFGAPAALGGVALLSMVVILINGTFVSIFERMTAPIFAALHHVTVDEDSLADKAAEATVPRWVRSLETFLPVLMIFGVYQLAKLTALDVTPQRTVSFGLVQPNTPCALTDERTDPESLYGGLLLKIPEADILLLPESALCDVGPLDVKQTCDFVARNLSVSGSQFVIAGGYRIDGDKQGYKLYNSAASYRLFSELNPPLVMPPEVYDKVHLVPFGEYIPGDKTFTVLQHLAPVGSCWPGEVKIFHTYVNRQKLNLGPAICYEDTDSDLIRRESAMGAQVFVFLTNDNWFSESIEPEQHAWQAVARAIETGRTIVRVGNSGVTGVVFADGTTDWFRDEDHRLCIDQDEARRVRVPVTAAAEEGRQTIYVRLGDWPIGLAFLLLITTMGVIKYKHEYEKRRTVSL